ncbi:hypothetical protein Dfer_2327 [Dyadobacter fermentans DSM 18053]|uniref:Uncharacterized protein n=2 Tax=Dyadobacter fermentans TaxID=94254 RepID=C6VZR8_DYAFD|nr:hypothetical protein Dfer_2327 [Dyadobacter fermentans DSM 18053]
MREAWKQFTDEFGKLFKLQICMTNTPEYAEEKKGRSSGQNAALAVKAVSLQSAQASGIYLDALRDASINQHLDISKLDTLVEIAKRVSRINSGMFEMNRFGRDLGSHFSRKALHHDQQKAVINRIDTCPTISMTVAGKGVKISGNTSYSNLVKTISRLVPIL